MTNKDIMDIAMRQSALESGCLPSDFEREDNLVVRSTASPGARAYLELPYLCDFTTYGNGVVASTCDKYMDFVRDFLARYPYERVLEFPLLNLVESYFSQMGLSICFQAAYYLPDLNCIKAEPIRYETRILDQDDFSELYTDEWDYALCEKRKELDVLGIGAYDGAGRLIGLAACSKDCDSMWQIGINVARDHQREGIACHITAKLAKEILEREVVPFYRTPWCNVKSIRNATRAGFRLGWCQVTLKDRSFSDKMIENLENTGRG